MFTTVNFRCSLAPLEGEALVPQLSLRGEWQSPERNIISQSDFLYTHRGGDTVIEETDYNHTVGQCTINALSHEHITHFCNLKIFSELGRLELFCKNFAPSKMSRYTYQATEIAYLYIQFGCFLVGWRTAVGTVTLVDI